MLLSTPSRRLALPDWTPERAELARFLSARNLNSLTVRVRIRSTRTDPRGPIVALWISLFFFFFFLPLLSNRAERDAPTKAAVQRRYWKSREYAMNIRKTYATVTRRERWLRIQHRRGVLDTSCLLGIVTFLTECGNKEGSLGAAPPPRIAHHLGRTFTITRNGVGTDPGGGRSKSAFLEFFSSLPIALLTMKRTRFFSWPRRRRGLRYFRWESLANCPDNRKKVGFTSNISFCKYFLQLYNLTF